MGIQQGKYCINWYIPIYILRVFNRKNYPSILCLYILTLFLGCRHTDVNFDFQESFLLQHLSVSILIMLCGHTTFTNNSLIFEIILAILFLLTYVLTLLRYYNVVRSVFEKMEKTKKRFKKKEILLVEPKFCYTYSSHYIA